MTTGDLTPAVTEFVVRDFHFESGEHLPELRLHARTLGTPRRDASGMVTNAVMILHGTTASGEAFLREAFAGALFGAGQLFDAGRTFIILPDAIGHGRSSKPSDGLRARFPRYNYDDMVRAQYQLVTEELGVNHLRLVMGTSMGGMHTWLWGINYPTFMDALMPLACLPVKIAGRNRMLRRMVIDAIRQDPDWQNGEYTSQPRGLVSAVYTLLFMVSSPWQWQQQAPTRAAADALFDEMVRTQLSRLDANDMLYQFDASRDYNPAPDLEKIRAPLLAINTADDQVNPPELGILEREIRRVRAGQAILIPTSEKTRGHGSHSLPELWEPYLAELLKASSGEAAD